MLRSKSCSFQHVFSTNFCTLFCMHTMLDSSVYCNALNIVHFYVCLVQITAFGFARVACSRLDSILCLTPCSKGKFIFTHFYYKLLHFRKYPALILKLHWWFLPLFSHLFLGVLMKWINRTNPYETYVCSICFFLDGSKVTNHPDSHGSPT